MLVRFGVHVSNIYRRFRADSQPRSFPLHARVTFHAKQDPPDVYQIRGGLGIMGVGHTQI